jgi:hypothetical protein
MSQRSRRHRVGAIAPLAVVVIAASLAATASIADTARGFAGPSYLQSAPDAAATEQAQRLFIGPYGFGYARQECETVDSGTAVSMPTPYLRCVATPLITYTKEWQGGWAALIFSPNRKYSGVDYVPNAPYGILGTCSRRLARDWWASVAPRRFSHTCPSSYRFAPLQPRHF